MQEDHAVAVEDEREDLGVRIALVDRGHVAQDRVLEIGAVDVLLAGQFETEGLVLELPHQRVDALGVDLEAAVVDHMTRRRGREQEYGQRRHGEGAADEREETPDQGSAFHGAHDSSRKSARSMSSIGNRKPSCSANVMLSRTRDSLFTAGGISDGAAPAK